MMEELNDVFQAAATWTNGETFYDSAVRQSAEASGLWSRWTPAVDYVAILCICCCRGF